MTDQGDEQAAPRTRDVAGRTPPEPVAGTTSTGAGVGGPVGRGGMGTGTGYVGGPQDDAGGPAGMRQVIGDELREARRSGEDVDTDSNLAQRDR